MFEEIAAWVFTALLVYGLGALCVVLTLVAIHLLHALEDE